MQQWLVKSSNVSEAKTSVEDYSGLCVCYSVRVCEGVLPSASEGTVGRMVRGRSHVMVSTFTGCRPRRSSACRPERPTVGVVWVR